jgi:SAM-dependent methyltransferase
MQEIMFRLHQEHQARHWWYTARREIVLAALRRSIRRDAAARPPLRLADIGCGPGGIVPWLGEFGTAFGVDPSAEAIAYARTTGVDVRRGGLPDELDLAGEDPLDAVLLLDVLEHVDEDELALRRIHSLLRPGGTLIMTVPAFPFLWSSHDVVNEHRRRYTRSGLRRKLSAAGFRIDELSYCNTVLFPAVAAARLGRRLLPTRPARPDVGSVPEPFNRVLHHLFAAERHILSVVPLPFGVSLVAAAVAVQSGEYTT